MVIGNSFARDWANVLNESDYSDIIEISMIPADKLYIVGYKNFGTSNGIIYNHARDDSYYAQSYQLPQEALDYNQSMQDKYGEHYINMKEAVQNEDGSVRVFTDDNHFISQDCRHLTRYGAIYYSKIVGLGKFFG